MDSSLKLSSQQLLQKDNKYKIVPMLLNLSNQQSLQKDNKYKIVPILLNPHVLQIFYLT